MSNDSAPLTIAAVASRTGISEHTLRAWEKRYGIPSPGRSACRYRLYDRRDVQLIEAMRRLMAQGVKASTAAERARSEMDRCIDSVDCGCLRQELLDALLREDEQQASGVFETAAKAYNACRLIAEIIAPVLYELGTAWERGEVGVDVEHFASSVLRARIEALTPQVEPAAGRLAILACAPGERHELPLLCLRLRLANHGWRSHGLGCDLPADSLVDAVSRHQPQMVAISVTRPCRRDAAIEMANRVREVAPDAAVLIGGQGVGDGPLPQGIGSQAEFWALVENSD